MHKLRLLSALIVVLLLLGGGYWLLNRPAQSTHPAVSAQPSPSAPVVAPPAKTTPTPVSIKPTPASPPESAAKTTPTTSVETLLADTSLDNKALMTGLSKLVLDASLPLESRNEAMSHLLNLSVEDPAPVLLPLIKNPALPNSLCQRILEDALNAPPSWQADACLAVLTYRKDKETLTEAREHLAFLTGADHGDNLAAWTQAVAQAKTDWK